MTTNELIEILKKYPDRIVAIKDLNYLEPFESNLDSGDFNYQPIDNYFQLPAYSQYYID